MAVQTVVIGTRGSTLALWQANWVKQALQARFPELPIRLEAIKTRGDRIQDRPLAQVGGKGLFVKEIEDALLAGKVDVAVHSMKDMPAHLPNGLVIGAVPPRADVRDVLISRRNIPLAALPAGARLGTSSLRRAAQLCSLRSDLVIVPLRGNLETRLRKLAEEKLDAIILAAAGVLRLDKADHITEYLTVQQMLPAVGQGALCVQMREADERIGPLLATLDDPPSRLAVLAERAFLRRLEGGCQAPIAAFASLDDDGLRLRGLVATLDGARVIADQSERLYNGTHELTPQAAEELGLALASQLARRGAEDILNDLKARFYAEQNS